MGEVWAAVHGQTEREVALKLVHQHAHAAADDVVRERMLREARACGRVAHRNVVEILDAGLTETGAPFLVMPLLRGETLAERLTRDHRLAWPIAAGLGADIARGLAAVHAAGIVHRDLKPGNVFLAYEPDVDGPVVKLLDFGVSKIVERFDASLLTTTGDVVGSPAYMSPEQVRGDRSIDHRSDLWSLGVILFEMVTGTFPFRGDTAYAVVAEILHGRIPRVSEWAPDVDDVLVSRIAQCLERDAHLRMGSATEMADGLKNRLSGASDGPPGECAVPHVPSIANESPPPERSWKRLVAVGLAGTVLAGALAFFAAVNGHRTSVKAPPPDALASVATASSPSVSTRAETSPVPVPVSAAPSTSASSPPSIPSTVPVPVRRPRAPAPSARPSASAPVPKLEPSGVKLPDDPG